MKLIKKIAYFTALSLVITSLAACGNSSKNDKISKNDNKEKKIIYTSFYPIYDFTKKIVGDKMEVVNMVPVGSEPHDYELTANDRKNLEKADAIIYNGAGMEEWVDDVKDAMKSSNTVFVDTSEGIKLEEGHHHEDEHSHDDSKKEEEHSNDDSKKEEHHHGLDDPHIWLYPLNAKKQLENIKEAVVKIDPNNKEEYENNYNKYSKEFERLDSEYKSKLERHKGKTIVVSHEAFGYICKAYGINQLGIEGLSPDTEPSPKKMAEIVDYVKNNNIKVIFFEELVSPKVAEAIAKETGATAKMLNPLEGLSQEDLNAGKDYIKVMEENLSAIVESFN